MRLIIFHYHLLPGGVTGVIAESVKAILPRLAEIDSVTLVCGNNENVEAVIETIVSQSDIARERVQSAVVPELGYVSEHNDRVHDLEDRLKELLTTRFSGADSIWWIHNYHLGKNPYFTNAVLDIVDRDQSQRVVFHIHDFPECARYENLRYLRSVVKQNVYPQRANVRYVVINSRDKRLLEQAGVRRGFVHLLQNPVAPGSTAEAEGGKASAEEAHATRSALAAAFRSDFPLFDPSHTLLLYPVRTIRRKNVLEVAAITRLVDDDCSLVVTLPGVSEQERKYSAMVEQAFREGLVPGLWGVGNHVEETGLSFGQLTRAADMVVSSSVQEGFGYQFVSAMNWGHPLFARYLDILEGVVPVFRGYPHDFYTKLVVPFQSPSLSSIRAYLRMRYHERVAHIGRFLTEDEREALSSDIESMLADDLVDFSYLAPQMQYTILRDLADPTYRTDIQSLNTGIVESIGRLRSSQANPQPDRIEGAFGYDMFAATTRSILADFDRLPPSDEDTNVQAQLVQSFASREYARLLYG